jgi:hypothetical protein
MFSIDRIDGVIDCAMHDGKAARGMNGRRLGAGRTNDYEQGPIPLDDWIYYFWELWNRISLANCNEPPAVWCGCKNCCDQTVGPQ